MDAHLISVVLATVLAVQSFAWFVRSRRLDPGDSVAARDRRLAPSRDAFDRITDAELRRGAALGRSVTLAILDVDHLAQVNDAHGYGSGDAVLVLVQEELVRSLRRIDTVLPLGSGAWGVLLVDIDPDGVEREVELLRNRLQRRLAQAAAGTAASVLVTLSAGLATSEHGAIGREDLFQAADQATLAAKLQGGNRTLGWGATSVETVRRASGRRRVQRDAQLATVLSLAEALDLRDADTSSHSRMVGHYAELMAQDLEMAPAHVERVRIAGLLHDIGKIGVPDSVLRKPGKLDDDEWAQMQQHPEIGARLLASIDAEDIRSWVLAHHERPDGRGYPFALSGAEIPIEARILAVADAYEAMTADRVYRKAPGPVIARAELEKWRGAQFDGDVVDAFLRVLDRLEVARDQDSTAHVEAA